MVGLTRRLFSCYGVVRSGVPDGLVFWFCLGYMVRYIVGLYGMVSRWCLGYGTSLVYMVWYIVDFFMVRCIVGF